MIFFRQLAILFFDLIDKFIHQKRIINYLKKSLREINIFIDIGAHKGTYTDLILNNLLVINKLILIEPQKNIFEFIKNKYKNNKNIIIYNNAISNKEKLMKLFINKHDLTSSLTEVDKKNKYLNLKAKLFGGSINQMITKKYNVKAINLKKLAKKEKIDYVDLIKIDTEGHEFQVLQGAGDFLKKSVKYIIVEFHNSNIFINYDAIKIEKYLKKNNFVLKKSFNFPFTTWEDRIYYNKKLIK
mgnify:CR=1 FL=1